MLLGAFERVRPAGESRRLAGRTFSLSTAAVAARRVLVLLRDAVEPDGKGLTNSAELDDVEARVFELVAPSNTPNWRLGGGGAVPRMLPRGALEAAPSGRRVARGFESLDDESGLAALLRDLSGAAFSLPKARSGVGLTALRARRGAREGEAGSARRPRDVDAGADDDSAPGESA